MTFPARGNEVSTGDVSVFPCLLVNDIFRLISPLACMSQPETADVYGNPNAHSPRFRCYRDIQGPPPDKILESQSAFNFGDADPPRMTTLIQAGHAASTRRGTKLEMRKLHFMKGVS